MTDAIDPLSPAPRVPPVATPRDRATATEFEAVFLGQMTQMMFDQVGTGEFSGGHGEEMFRGVLAEKLGAEIARRGGIGLAPVVLDQILKLQEGTRDGQ